MLFMGNGEATIRSKGINIPKKFMSPDISLKFSQNELHYFPIAGKDKSGFNCLYVDFTDAEGFLNFIERATKCRESFKDEGFSYPLQERFKYFDSFLKETMENPKLAITPNLMSVPKSIGGRIFFGDLVKHILEPEKVLVVGQRAHIKIYELEQGNASLKQSWERHKL